MPSCLFDKDLLMWQVNTIMRYGKGWLTQFWNMIDLAMYTIQFIVFVAYLSRAGLNDEWFTVLLAIQSILLFCKMQYFMRWALWALAGGSAILACTLTESMMTNAKSLDSRIILRVKWPDLSHSISHLHYACIDPQFMSNGSWSFC